MTKERGRKPIPQRRRVPIRKPQAPSQADLNDLQRWVVADLSRSYRIYDFVLDDDETEDLRVFSIETASRRYTIAASKSGDTDDGGSLFCLVDEPDGKTRKLASGPLSRKNWKAIARDIFSLEKVSTSEFEPVDNWPLGAPVLGPDADEALARIPMIGEIGSSQNLKTEDDGNETE